MAMIVSGCLLGHACRYDGASRPCAAVQRLATRQQLLAVCPETAGGLPQPREPSEIQPDATVRSRDGHDVTVEYHLGAQRTFDRARSVGARLAILKSKSPSCGSGLVYDGTFQGRLVAGDGVTTQLLKKEGICVVSENIVADCEPSFEHPVAIILGTGLGDLAKHVKPVRRISYRDIEGFPQDAVPVPGHSYEALVGTIRGVPVVLYPGRVHLYQGYSAAQVASLVRHAHSIGCRDLILAGSSGAIYDHARPGLGLITDHINFTGTNPLAERNASVLAETPFVGMHEAYSPYLREICITVAADKGIDLTTGVYAGMIGPSFETSAEVDMLGRLGVSYVGNSCVTETVMARALDMNVLGITLAAHFAAEPNLTHDDIISFADDHAEQFEELVCGVLEVLGCAEE